MRFFCRQKIGILLLYALLFSWAPVSFAQTPSPAASLQEQAQLQQQLQQIEDQIAQYQQELGSIQGQKNTLQNKIKQLQKQQAALNLQIKATNLQITALGGQMQDTTNAISDNEAKQQSLQRDIGSILQLIHQNDDQPLLYTLVSNKTLADAFDQVQNYTKLTDSLKSLLDQAVQVKAQLDQHLQDLAQQQDSARNLLSIKTLQQQQLSGSVNDQNNLLQQTKGRESSYQAMLSNQQQQAAAIRSRLYDLLGVSQQITFGDAVKIAQWASAQTGVRAAFLLAILTQESNLGKNVGTCNRPGDPPTKSYKVVMNPTRDIPAFLQITSSLGMNPDITPVSCPMRDSRGNRLGWGGAMGPAQFIPSTWMGYKDKVTAISGKTANPWDIRDAFLASAIKLAADGAGNQGGEWAAAMRYFSGSTNSRYRFYGDSVVATAAQYQNDINQLS